MPVSNERLDQICPLVNGGRLDDIDTSTFSESDWDRFEEESEAEIEELCQSNSDSEELHAFATNWNWDFGTWPLELILKNPACEAATALQIYWAGCPEYLLQYANRQEVEAEADHLLDAFDFVSGIEARYMAGEFRVGSIAFDPATPDGNPSGYCLVGRYDDMRGRFVRTLPPVMYAAVRYSGAP